MHRAVVDPNVLISAVIAPNGTSAKVLDAWLDGLFDLVVSQKLLAELERVLLRPKFRAHLSDTQAEMYIALFENLASFAEDPELTESLTPDPGDDYLVALAQSVNATYLVSGDKHLLGLANATPPVLNSKDFLEQL